MAHPFRARAIPPLLAVLLLAGGLPSQEFDFGIIAPAAFEENSTFEVRFTITSREIASGRGGAQGWTLGVAHRGLTLLSLTTSGTVVDEVFDGGFAFNEMTSSSEERPENDGFISGIILSVDNPRATLPPEGTVEVARAVYHAGRSACAGGAEIAIRDGLQGSGVAIRNGVTWESRTFPPLLDARTFAGCVPNDHRLHLEGPGGPLAVRLGERREVEVLARLAQRASTASSFTLAVAHDASRLQLHEVEIHPALEPFLGDEGFVLLEITSGPENSGFTAQGEIAGALSAAIPAPDQPLAAARYGVLPISDPSLVGTRLSTEIRFAPSLRGSGGLVENAVLPAGNLTREPLQVRIDVLEPARFVRGDAGGDGLVDISDPLALLFHLYGAMEETRICREAANANDDLHLDLTDAIFILERLFVAPLLPFPAPAQCGADPSTPSLSCARTSCP